VRDIYEKQWLRHWLCAGSASASVRNRRANRSDRYRAYQARLARLEECLRFRFPSGMAASLSLHIAIVWRPKAGAVPGTGPNGPIRRNRATPLALPKQQTPRSFPGGLAANENRAQILSAKRET
jgi:hypothetical protein